MFQFFPRDEKFFEMLERASSNLEKGPGLFAPCYPITPTLMIKLSI